MSEKKASMADFEELLTQQMQSYKKGFNPGDRVKGTVSAINDHYVTLDVNAKREGLVPVEDLTLANGELRCGIGDTVEVIFSGMQGGAFLFTGSLNAKQVVDRTLADAFTQKMPIEGTVEKEINGGYEVTVAGQRAFCPFSQINLFRQEDAEYVGHTFNFLISEYSEDDRGVNVIVSRRAVLEREREAQRQELVDDLYVGMVVTGTVTRLVDFGVFVELGGAEGLIPLKEISWTRDVKPEDVVKVGDKVDVLIKELDWDRNRISLSLRGAQGDPWNDAVAKFPQGTAFTGKVTHIEPFGAFVELIPGVEGLIPVSRLGRGRRLASPKEVLNLGDAILVEVDSVDLDRHRFSLKPVDERLKALKPGAIEPGAKMEGLVESVQAFGVFVRLSEEKTGLLHASETGIPKGTAQFGKMEHQFPVDSKIEVVIKSVDGDRISLTLPAEWDKRQQADEANHDVSTWLNDQKEASGAFGSLGGLFDGLKL